MPLASLDPIQGSDPVSSCRLSPRPPLYMPVTSRPCSRPFLFLRYSDFTQPCVLKIPIVFAYSNFTRFLQTRSPCALFKIYTGSASILYEAWHVRQFFLYLLPCQSFLSLVFLFSATALYFSVISTKLWKINCLLTFLYQLHVFYIFCNHSILHILS